MVFARDTTPKSSGTSKRASSMVLNSENVFTMAREALNHALPLINLPLIFLIAEAVRQSNA